MQTSPHFVWIKRHYLMNKFIGDTVVQLHHELVRFQHSVVSTVIITVAD